MALRLDASFRSESTRNSDWEGCRVDSAALFCRALRAMAVCLLLRSTVCVAAEPGVLYRDPHAPIEQRVLDLLSRMTLEEKVAQLHSMWFSKRLIEDSDGAFSD